MTDSRRRFNLGERVSLYLAADGYCQGCGCELLAGWHADHVQPHARGGRTDLENGQALCEPCNLRKGDSVRRVLPGWPSGHPLRVWQAEAIDRLHHLRFSKASFLLVGTPGAGKTRVALKVGYDYLASGLAERLVIVVPTTHLKRQWVKAAAKVGIQLDPNWPGDSPEAADFHGVVVTYQQVASKADMHARCCRRPTLVIFDEIHHAGDELAWGGAVQKAFACAGFRLLLSGTPFRSDNNRIPWVEYETDPAGGYRSRADYSYDYGKALHDGVCRYVFFPSYEGEMDWWKDGEQFERVTFADKLSEQHAAARLRTALNPQGDWLRTVIRDADRKLTAIRDAGHPDAAGLILATDVEHAREIAKRLQKIAGEAPTVAVYDDPEASARIEAFADNRERWIIAVKMVSEGVDIPRLRVGVYATNVTAELFFRQVVGRFVRSIESLEEQAAYLYIPRVAELIAFAQKIKEERDHQLQEEAERARRTREGEPDEAPSPLPSVFLPGQSKGMPDDVFHANGAITPSRLQQAESIRREMGLKNSPEQIAALLMLGATMYGGAVAPEAAKALAPAAPVPRPLVDRKDDLRKRINIFAGKLAARRGIEIKDIHGLWKKEGGTAQAKATEEELQAKLDWVQQQFLEDADGV